MSTVLTVALVSVHCTAMSGVCAWERQIGGLLPVSAASGITVTAVIVGVIAKAVESPATWAPPTWLTRRMAAVVLKSGIAPPGVQPLTAQLPAEALGRAAGLVISVKPAGPAPSGSSSIFPAPSWPSAVHWTSLSVSPTRQAPACPIPGGVVTAIWPVSEKGADSASVSKQRFEG